MQQKTGGTRLLTVPSKLSSSLDALEATARGKAVDELGALDLKLALLKFDVARQKELRTVVQGWASALPGDQAISVSGEKYRAFVGFKEKRRFVPSMVKLFKRLGKDVFLENCGFTLGKLEDLIPGPTRDNYIDEDRTGPRTVITLPVAAPVNQAIAA
jgi:hypothetical protein